MHWPPWWDWELESGPHLVKRMLDRNFSQVDLRTMLEHSKNYRSDIIDGRWVETVHHRRTWEVVVEPDAQTERLVVITAYPCWES